jgi:hypothetical protein
MIHMLTADEVDVPRGMRFFLNHTEGVQSQSPGQRPRTFFLLPFAFLLFPCSGCDIPKPRAMPWDLFPFAFLLFPFPACDISKPRATPWDLFPFSFFLALGVAIREFPLNDGEADYPFCADDKVMGVVEAKPTGHGTLTGVEKQSAKYAKSLPAGRSPSTMKRQAP